MVVILGAGQLRGRAILAARRAHSQAAVDSGVAVLSQADGGALEDIGHLAGEGVGDELPQLVALPVLGELVFLGEQLVLDAADQLPDERWFLVPGHGWGLRSGGPRTARRSRGPRH